MDTMQIERDELKALLDRGAPLKLVMAMSDWAFAMAHIPGSLVVDSPLRAPATLDRDDEIIVYCSGPACPFSLRICRVLTHLGFRRVRHFAGGLSDWAGAGYPLTGTLAA